jgi:diacylglycerol kinase (ATP)
MTGLKYFLNRLRWRLVWSLAGLRDAYVNQYSFRIWVWVNGLSAVLACILPMSGAERALIIALGILVLAAEVVNTAVEYTVDYISTERHPLAGRAKDAASACVFLTALAAGVVWVVVLVGMIFG